MGSADGESHARTRSAMLLMVVAMLMLPGIDAIAKWTSATLPPGQVTWSRFLFQSLLMAPLAMRAPGPMSLATLPVHLARGTLIALATLLFFSALRHLPIADAIAILFVEPLLVTGLSALLLDERVGRRRWSAVLVGFAGALVIIRPSFAAFGVAAILPLGAALAFAFYIILTRRLAPSEDPARMQFLSGACGFVVMSALLAIGTITETPLLDPVWPSATEWALLALLGLIATVGHLLIVHALQRASATVLAPFQYLEIVSATVLGYVVFDDLPDSPTWLGIAMIVGAGMYVFHRERVRANVHDAA